MAFLMALFALAGLVWWLGLAHRLPLLWLAALYLVVAGACGYDIYHFEIAGRHLTLDRLLLLLTASAAAWQWWRAETAARPWTGVDRALVVFMIWLVVNTVLHDWQRAAPDQIPIVPHLLDGYLIPLFLYFTARQAALQQRSIYGVYFLLGLFGVYLSLTAFCEVTHAWQFVFPKQIADPQLGIHFGRARGPFLQSVRLGIYLLAALVVTCVPLFWAGCWGRPGRLLALGLAGLYTAAISVTYTRSIWLGWAAVVVGLCLFALRGRPRRLAILSLLAAGLLAVGMTQDRWLAFEREYGAAETKQSTEMRAVFAYVSWLMVQDRPWTGFGFGHFPHEKEAYLQDRQTRMQLESIRGYVHHNTFLSILVELGIVGCLIYLAVLWGWGRQAWSTWRNPRAPTWMRGHGLVTLLFLGAFLLQMLFHEVTYAPVENGLLYLMTGVTSAMAAGQRSQAARAGIGAWTVRRWHALRWAAPVPGVPTPSVGRKP